MVPAGGNIIDRLIPLSGSEALNMILDQDNPLQIVQGMNRMDLFWLIKKIGTDDSLPLLRLASQNQWQYIIDMELWRKDHLDIGETFTWLERLHSADPDRLAEWLYSEDGNILAHFYFTHSIEVIIGSDDSDFVVPEGSFTLDGQYFIKILDIENEEAIKEILQSMAGEDIIRFQALLLGLMGVISAEVEEDMYRMKSMRLAEDGYLPFEEATSIYSYQKAEQLKVDESEYLLNMPDDLDSDFLIPVMPLTHTKSANLLGETISRIEDRVTIDRLCLEFAGLCNQIFSADGVRFENIDDLARIGRKAAGYINIGLEKLSRGNPELSDRFVRNHPLISLFRAGFSASLELKWEADQWRKGAWFLRKGFETDFWGEEWGGTLKGLFMDKPLFFTGLKENDEYRDFEVISEVGDSRTILKRIEIMDKLLNAIFQSSSWDKEMFNEPFLSYHYLIFTYWACHFHGVDEIIRPISRKEAEAFFKYLRKGYDQPPFRMAGYKEVFLKDIIEYDICSTQEETHFLRETLSMLWQEFVDEFAYVDVTDVDSRYVRFIMIDSGK